MTPFEQLQAALPAEFYLQHAAETGSTNEDAKRWLASGPTNNSTPQALFIADLQTAGRGRRERAWQSPPGNLYASLVLPQPGDLRRLGHYGFSLSLAIHDAVRGLNINAPVQVKWPNDVLIDGKKCAGILIELAGTSNHSGIILGFGVNLQHAPDIAAYAVTRLREWIGTQAAPAFCAHVLRAFFALQALPADQLLARWKAAAKGIGEPITVNLPETQLTGTFADLAADGALLLDMETGRRAIHSGEVFFGR